jgi:hypothetical protein
VASGDRAPLASTTQPFGRQGCSLSSLGVCWQNFVNAFTQSPDPYTYEECAADGPCQDLRYGLASSGGPYSLERCKDNGLCTVIGVAYGGVGGIQGNSYDSPETSYLYMLEDKQTGRFLKWGITDDPAGRYSGTLRQTTTMTVVASGRREDMAAVERVLVQTDAGPMNRVRWRSPMRVPAVEDDLSLL